MHGDVIEVLIWPFKVFFYVFHKLVVFQFQISQSKFDRGHIIGVPQILDQVVDEYCVLWRKHIVHFCFVKAFDSFYDLFEGENRENSLFNHQCLQDLDYAVQRQYEIAFHVLENSGIF